MSTSASATQPITIPPPRLPFSDLDAGTPYLDPDPSAESGPSSFIRTPPYLSSTNLAHLLQPGDERTADWSSASPWGGVSAKAKAQAWDRRGAEEEGAGFVSERGMINDGAVLDRKAGEPTRSRRRQVLDMHLEPEPAEISMRKDQRASLEPIDRDRASLPQLRLTDEITSSAERMHIGSMPDVIGLPPSIPARPLVHHPDFPRRHPTPLFDPYTATLRNLTALLDSRQLTSVHILQVYLAQISRWNPYLRAITHLAPLDKLLEEARACDDEMRKDGFRRDERMLCGIPVIVKDNIGTAAEGGMPTTAGSYALLGNILHNDSFVVQRLKAAGAIILGKANMTELASYRSVSVPDGWSGVGGQTINAYDPGVSPGTSSSGNGVALAAGFCPLSIGTETDGSITLPALQSALYALKPSTGLISRGGIVPFAPTFDSPGPMARDAWSVALGMDVLAAEDEADVMRIEVERLPRGVKYTDFCVDASFAGLRIGVPRAGCMQSDPWLPYDHPLPLALEKAFAAMLDTIAAHGGHVVDPAEMPSAADGSLWACMKTARSLVVKADFKHYFGAYLEGTKGERGCGSIEEVIKFNTANAPLELPPGIEGQELLISSLTAPPITSPEYAAAKAEMRRVAGDRGLFAVLDEYGLDAIACVGKGKFSVANMTGAPIGTVPLGLSDSGEPIGAYFIARPGKDGVLLRIMAAWEKAVGPMPLPPIAAFA